MDRLQVHPAPADTEQIPTFSHSLACRAHDARIRPLVLYLRQMAK